jgi:hypothetical protein
VRAVAEADGLPSRTAMLVFLGEEGRGLRPARGLSDKVAVTIRWLLDGQDHTCAYECSPGHVHPIRCLVGR